MKKGILINALILIGLASGCGEPFDSTIMNHLDGIRSVEDKDFTVEFYLEENDDLNASSVEPEEFLEITKAYYELTGVDELKYVMLYVPHNNSTWHELMQGDEERFGDYGAHTTETQLGDYLLLINPTYWRDLPREDIIQIFVHELTHQVCKQLEGTTDRDHKLEQYWGPNGLMWRIIELFIGTGIAQ